MIFLLQYFILTSLMYSYASSEVITLIKENNIKCILTDDSVDSDVYIKNCKSCVKRNIQELENWIDNDWKESNITEQFETGSQSLPDVYKYSFQPSVKKSFLNLNLSTCVTMYVSIDTECYLNIKLESHNETLYMTTIKGFNEKGAYKTWKKIEIQTDNNEEKNISFYRGNYHGTVWRFWAIKEIRQCNLTTVTYNIKSVNETFESNVSLCQVQNSSNAETHICENPSYIGKYCNISCSQVLGSSYSSCQQHRMCSENNCSCLWGYQGPNCNQTCETNNWGVNCQKNCSERCKGCNSVTGECSECLTQYFGNNCSQEFPVVQKAPELISIKENFVEIQLNLEFHENQTVPDNFAVQSKKLNSLEEFKYISQNYTYLDNVTKKIQLNLTTTESYQVRIVLIVNNQSFQLNVPELIINKKSLNWTHNNNFIELSWSKPTMQNVTNYEIVYNCSYTFCNNVTDNKTHTVSSDNTTVATKINVKDAFSSCHFKLYAEKNKSKILIDEITASNSSKPITENELPKNLSLSLKTTVLELGQCQDFTGPLNYSIEYRCLNEWCYNNNTIKMEYALTAYTKNISVDVELQPNISYNVFVNATRVGQIERSKLFPNRTILSKTQADFKNDSNISDFTANSTNSHVSSKNQDDNNGDKRSNNTKFVTYLVIGIIVALVLFSVFCSIICFFKSCSFKKRTSTKKIKTNNIIKFSDLIEKDALLSENIRTTFAIGGVKINNFETYISSTLEEDQEENLITKQFQEMSKPNLASCKNGQLEKNRNKNRYTNVLPYDSTRVLLSNDSGSDYINANYIHGYKISNGFIATQAPMNSTINDFWLMVYQENVEVLIMLCNLIENDRFACPQYWPDHLSIRRLGEFSIMSVSTTITPNYIHRKLQYTSWPDHGVPLNIQDFIVFIKKIMEFPQQNPVVVHCNAGCGRTGTFILCDIVIRMAINEKSVNFASVLKAMREQRAGLVNSVDQYIFAHRVVLEYFFGENFSIDISDNFHLEVEKALDGKYLDRLMRRLNQTKTKYEKKQLKLQFHLTDEDKHKNRFPSILPASSQIFIPPSSQNSSSYINAIYVDCFRYPKKFIVTQQPLPNTVEDFWKIVMEYEVDTIISLNKIPEKDPLCPVFWPQDNHQGSFLKTINTDLTFYSKNDNHNTFNLIRIKAQKKTEKKSKIVNIVSVKNWKRETFKPPSVTDLISVWKKTVACNGKIVVTCYDGATASGLFVALAYMLEQINMEHKCDVFTAVKTIQQTRLQFIEHPEQLKFLYQAALEYIQEFSTYGNFT